MKTIQGPAIFLAQFAGDSAPFDTLPNIVRWAAGHGYKGVQIPTRDARLIDLKRAAESRGYCDEVKGMCAEAGVSITELSTHLQGQLVAVHPVYDLMMDGFAELARRWRPILDAFDAQGVDLCYEVHPGEDLHDGDSYEMFLDAVGNHARACLLYDPSHFVLQQLDYLDYIDIFHERIRAFHVKDAEFRPTGREGVYGGYQSWLNRAGRFRSPGDGQVDFAAIFSKLTQYGFDGWAVLEWECCLKDSEQGAAEGAPFIARHIIRTARKAFDDFAASGVERKINRHVLGIS